MDNKIDIENVFYHGIVDWFFYDMGDYREDFCLEKLDSILKHRFIYRPCVFKENGIYHDDCANPYTYYSTFVACHPNGVYSERFRNCVEDSAYDFATKYSEFGLLISLRILEELEICPNTFCDYEIVINGDISLDRFGLGLFVYSDSDEELIEKLANLLKKYNYDWSVVNISDGSIIRSNCKSFVKKLK